MGQHFINTSCDRQQNTKAAACTAVCLHSKTVLDFLLRVVRIDGRTYYVQMKQTQWHPRIVDDTHKIQLPQIVISQTLFTLLVLKGNSAEFAKTSWWRSSAQRSSNLPSGPSGYQPPLYFGRLGLIYPSSTIFLVRCLSTGHSHHKYRIRRVYCFDEAATGRDETASPSPPALFRSPR